MEIDTHCCLKYDTQFYEPHVWTSDDLNVGVVRQINIVLQSETKEEKKNSNANESFESKQLTATNFPSGN